jgi:hypothetical protein
MVNGRRQSGAEISTGGWEATHAYGAHLHFSRQMDIAVDGDWLKKSMLQCHYA